MAEGVSTPFPQPPEKKKIPTATIVIAVIVLMCCCCFGMIGLLLAFGDPILSELGLYGFVPPLVALL